MFNSVIVSPDKTCLVLVLFAAEEPEPGFSAALMGLMGMIAITGAGVLKTFYMSKEVRLDLTPQDVAVKALCYYTVKTAGLYKTSQKPIETPVFINSSCTHCDTTFVEYITIMQTHGFWKEAAFEKCFLIPGLYCTDNRFVFFILVTHVKVFLRKSHRLLKSYILYYRPCSNIFYPPCWLTLLWF